VVETLLQDALVSGARDNVTVVAVVNPS
jgi:hypothetical protein